MPASPTARYDDEAMTAFVRAHTDQIPARELDVFSKLYIEGRSKQQAARLLGISKNTVGTLLRRLRRGLARAEP